MALLRISLDNANSHLASAEKYALPFPLLSGSTGAAVRAFGALCKPGPLCFAGRHSFMTDPHGRVARVYRQVKPAQHQQQLIEALRALRAATPQPSSEVDRE